ncbi:MAG: hypothetical protein PHW62_00660 [Candidatus Ratteibacteria bacterium]|nr:hypothetical protein [Candidatus Ratteibacteria bacterium]
MASKQTYSNPNVTLAIAVLAILVLYFAAITIPFGNTKDVYIDFTVQKEILASPKLIEVTARVQPSTLWESPGFLGAIFGLQAGDVSVSAQTETVKKIIKVGDVTVAFDKQERIVLKDVPLSENKATLILYEGTTVKETKVIGI